MISIIISTYQEDFYQQLVKNISETIGVEYELIPIFNPQKYSICEAYNIGVKKAKYEFFCFLHEDVLIETENWGKLLIDEMKKDTSLGMIGVVGTKFRASYPAALTQSPFLHSYMRGRVLHKNRDEKDFQVLDFDKGENDSALEEVLCLDGVFLFSKREVFSVCSFDQKLLQHFHAYDIDISLQVFSAGYKLAITRKLDLYHFSTGNYGKENTRANRLIAKKWWRKLPMVSRDVDIPCYKKKLLNVQNSFYFLFSAIKNKLKNFI